MENIARLDATEPVVFFCGFGCHLEKEPNRFQMLKQTHPKLWEYCMKPIESGGLGMRNVMEYISVPIE